MEDPEEEGIETRADELPWELITELEIYQLLKAAKGTTAPGVVESRHSYENTYRHTSRKPSLLSSRDLWT
jgi:hypothetical protein